MGLRYARPTSEAASLVQKHGLYFGLVLGLFWTIELVAGNLNVSHAKWAIVPPTKDLS